MWLTVGFFIFIIIIAWSIALYQFHQYQILKQGLQELWACLIRIIGIFISLGTLFGIIGFILLSDNGLFYGMMLSLGASVVISVILLLLWGIAAYEKASQYSESLKQNPISSDDTLLDDELIY